MEKIIPQDTVEAILTLHQELSGLARSSLEKALRVGELLSEVKARLPHGGWLPWCQENLEFDQKTGWRYMRLFVERGKLGSMSNLTLTEAYRHLKILWARKKSLTRTPKPPKPKPQPQPAASNPKPKPAAEILTRWISGFARRL